MKKSLVFALVGLLAFAVFTSCSKDSTSPEDNQRTPEVWEGTWLSAGTNVAPLLVAFFNYDSVRVVLGENTVSLSSHIAAGAWSTTEGTYTVTKSQTGDIHVIDIVYAAFTQAGIIQVIAANPDTLKLEAVQTVPDIGATPPTVTAGFGSTSGGAFGTTNIQVYLKEN